jgi:hypothetical protein
MNFTNYKKGFDKPTTITGEQYGTKISVQIDHSDTELDEIMDAFETIVIGLGYHSNSWKQWILDRANEYQEEENEKWEETFTYEDFKKDEEFTNLRHGYENREELENDFFGNFNIDEKRMDIIGQNGNEGLHYRATEEDEDEFDDYGMRVSEDRVTFEWGDEPEDEENLFDGDEWEANENLKAANERYKKVLKTLSAKQKKKSK